MAVAACEVSFTHALARLLAASPDPSLRDGARALELAEQAIAEPTLQRAETLAMSYAAAGRFDEAVQVQRDLIDQAKSRRLAVLPELNRQLQPFFKRYEIKNRSYTRLLWGWFIKNHQAHTD